jgi:hypothetical protein
VLIVDDHAEIRRATALLEAGGFRVVGAAADAGSVLRRGPTTAGVGMGPEADG